MVQWLKSPSRCETHGFNEEHVELVEMDDFGGRETGRGEAYTRQVTCAFYMDTQELL